MHKYKVNFLDIDSSDSKILVFNSRKRKSINYSIAYLLNKIEYKNNCYVWERLADRAGACSLLFSKDQIINLFAYNSHTIQDCQIKILFFNYYQYNIFSRLLLLLLFNISPELVRINLIVMKFDQHYQTINLQP